MFIQYMSPLKFPYNSDDLGRSLNGDAIPICVTLLQLGPVPPALLVHSEMN